MRAGNRQHISRNGTKKVRFKTEAAAMKVAVEMSGEKHTYNSYLCPICNYYHVGERPKSLVDRQINYRQNSIDNAIVGQLIGALKAVLQKGTEE